MLNGKIDNNTVESTSGKNRHQGSSVKDMSKRKKKKPTRKRIHNPKTGRYYQIRQRSSSKGQRGTIMGTWSPPTEIKRKKKRK